CQPWPPIRISPPELRGGDVEADLAEGRDRPVVAGIGVADAGELDVGHRAQVRTVFTMPQRPTVRCSSIWKTRRSIRRPSPPMTSRLPTIRSVLRHYLGAKTTPPPPATGRLPGLPYVLRSPLEAKMPQPSPQLVAAIISPPTTAIQARANAWRSPAMTKGSARGSTTCHVGRA